MAKRWQFIKKDRSLPTEPTPPETVVLPSWYQSIHSLPLRRFEDCLLDNNLQALTITGNPSSTDLASAWGNIKSEYAEAVGNAEYKVYTSTYKEIGLLNITYEQINALVDILRISYSDYFHKELNGLLRLNIALPAYDQPQYHKELDKCERRNKANLLKLQMKQDQLKGLESKMLAEGGNTQDRMYFTTMLIILSSKNGPNGYHITKDITVAEYCEYLNQYNQFADSQKRSK